MAWGKKRRRSPWYSPSSYMPSQRTRQKYGRAISYSISKHSPTIAAVLLGMVCILLAKRVAHKLHMARLRWQYDAGRRSAKYVREALMSPFTIKKKKKKSSSSHRRRKSYLKYSQDYQKAQEDKIIPYTDVLGVFSQSKTPPQKMRKAIHHHQQHAVTPEDKENNYNNDSEQHQLRARRGTEGRRALHLMQ